MKKFISVVAALFVLLYATIACGGSILGSPKFQAFDSSGVPLSGGFLYTYIAGTTTNQTTYSDAALSTPNSNPVVLDSRGEATVYLSGTYKLVLKTSADVTIWTIDNVASESLSLWDAPSELTIASGVVTPTGTTHSIDTEAAASSDILTVIADDNIADGDMLIIYPESDTRTIIVDHESGVANEIHLLGDSDFTMDTADHALILQLRGTEWYEISRTSLADTATYGVAVTDTADTFGSDADTLAQSGTTNHVSSDTLGYTLSYLVGDNRSVFTYGNNFAITVSGGSYPLHGTNDLVTYWVSTVTTANIAGVADTFYYLYLDDSAILTDPLITTDELIWSTTAPTYSSAKRGWYNSNDRCIFAVLTEADGTITPFTHDGSNFVSWNEELAGGQTAKTDYDFTGIDVDTTPDNVYLVMPDFATVAQVTLGGDYVSAAGVLYYSGLSIGVGNHKVNTVSADITDPYSTVIVMTDSDGILHVELSTSGDETVDVYTNGWFIPGGM